MISRRNFFSILLMMAAILFLFQFTQMARASGNHYDVNDYAMEAPVSGADRWSGERITDGSWTEVWGDGTDVWGDSMEAWENGAESQGDSTGVPGTASAMKNGACGKVLFLGNREGEAGQTASAWCLYSKRQMEVWQSGTSAVPTENAVWDLVLIDAAGMDPEQEKAGILALAGLGVPMVFCSLPEASIIQETEWLAELLGISEVRRQRAEIQGIHLFSGFLLGGEAIYQAVKEEEEEFQDLALQVPWYVTGKGTKTYMVGMMEEDQAGREDFPALIWRNTWENTFVFAVNGDYMQGLTGMGILSAMLYEANPYVLYPVVNAQNAATLDFPYLAPENALEMEEIYSREPQAALRDVFWPGMVSLSANSGCKLTCFLGTKYQYTDPALPSEEDLPFYLQQMKEIDAEAGRSLNFAAGQPGDGVTLEKKGKEDGAFFNGLDSGYRYSAVYLEEMPENAEGLFQEAYGLEAVRTVMCAERGARPLLSYLNDAVTIQGVTNVAGEYTYSMDLQQRSVITALGYGNLLIDLHRLRWPETEQDRWEQYSDEVFSNINTYWTRFEGFDRTTLSESDGRVRTLLNLDYRERSGKDRISLRTAGGGAEAWFILRIHGKEIEKVEGGEYETLETGAYLIHTLSNQVEIYLKQGQEVLWYEEPFGS